jgi:hypothetical protein
MLIILDVTNKKTDLWFVLIILGGEGALLLALHLLFLLPFFEICLQGS